MKTSKLIRKMCAEQNISIAELARRIGQSPQNFGKKLKRETVSGEEMQQIAEVFGVTYAQVFLETQNTNEPDDYEKSLTFQNLIMDFFSEKVGLHILAEENVDLSKYKYIRLDDSILTSINSFLQFFPHYMTELKAAKASTDTYRVIYDKGLGHLQQSAKNRELFRANIVEFGTNNNIKDQAELEKLNLRIISPGLVVFDIAASITNQYFLTRINNRLTSLDNKLEYVQKFLEESKKSDLWANGQFLKEVSWKIYEITQDDQYRFATLATVQNIRINALSNVNFYHKMMSSFIEKCFDTKNHDFSVIQNLLKKYYDCFDAYCYAVYIYGLSYVIEIALSQITEEQFLIGVKNTIENVIDRFNHDCTDELNQFIEKAKILNPGLFEKTLANLDLGSKPLSSPYSMENAFLELGLRIANIIAKSDTNKKSDRKKEIQLKCEQLKKRVKTSYDDLNSILSVIDRMNDIFNKPVELLIDKESVYLILPNTDQETIE